MQGFLKLTWVELKLFVRDPFATVFVLVRPLIMLLLLAAVFGDTPPTDMMNGLLVFRGVSGDDYHVAASVALVIAAIGLLILPTHIASYREQGVLRRFEATSVPPRAIFASQLMVGLIAAIVGSLFMVAIATPIYGTMLPEDLIGILAAIALSMLCFTAIGFALGSFFPTARAAQGIGLILFFVLWMLSCTGPPRAVLPDGVRRLGEYEPLTHVVIAIRDPWSGHGWDSENLLTIAVVTVAAAAIGIWRFRWD